MKKHSFVATLFRLVTTLFQHFTLCWAKNRSKALFEGLIFGGAYLRREICVSKSIGLALQLEVNLPFLLCFTLYLRAIFQLQAPRGLYLKGRFNGGFFTLPVWGAYIWRGFYMKGLIFGILRYALLVPANHTCFKAKLFSRLQKIDHVTN